MQQHHIFRCHETKKYLRRHPVIGVYKFYENWSTESFRNFQKRNISDIRAGQRQFGIILSFIGY